MKILDYTRGYERLSENGDLPLLKYVVFNSDLSNRHCNEYICLKIEVYFLFIIFF